MTLKDSFCSNGLHSQDGQPGSDFRLPQLYGQYCWLQVGTRPFQSPLHRESQICREHTVHMLSVPLIPQPQRGAGIAFVEQDLYARQEPAYFLRISLCFSHAPKTCILSDTIIAGQLWRLQIISQDSSPARLQQQGECHLQRCL